MEQIATEGFFPSIVRVDHEKPTKKVLKISSSENPFSAESKMADMSQKRRSIDQKIMIFFIRIWAIKFEKNIFSTFFGHFDC